MKKYLRFKEIPNPRRKTKIFFIVNNHDVAVGKIFWYCPWRKYCWKSFPHIIWSSDCDKQRSEFIEQLNKDYKKDRNKNKKFKNN